MRKAALVLLLTCLLLAIFVSTAFATKPHYQPKGERLALLTCNTFNDLDLDGRWDEGEPAVSAAVWSVYSFWSDMIWTVVPSDGAPALFNAPRREPLQVRLDLASGWRTVGITDPGRYVLYLKGTSATVNVAVTPAM